MVVPWRPLLNNRPACWLFVERGLARAAGIRSLASGMQLRGGHQCFITSCVQHGWLTLRPFAVMRLRGLQSNALTYCAVISTRKPEVSNGALQFSNKI